MSNEQLKQFYIKMDKTVDEYKQMRDKLIHKATMIHTANVMTSGTSMIASLKLAEAADINRKAEILRILINEMENEQN